jgi:hypothetical protein
MLSIINNFSEQEFKVILSSILEEKERKYYMIQSSERGN